MALALFALGYLGLPVVDAATQHVAHAVRAEVGSVTDGNSGYGHRCLLPHAFGVTLPSATLPGATAAGVESETPPDPRALLLPRSHRGHARPRAPPHS